MLFLRMSLIQLLIITFSNASWAQQPYVDSMIIIAVDVSGSIDANEYELQKQGIITALKDPSIQSLLNQCSSNGIALTYLEWSGVSQFTDFSRSDQSFTQVIPWTLLKKPQDLDDFAHSLNNASRSSKGETDIAQALKISGQLFLRAPFESDRKIISLSTDGRQGYTVPGLSAADYLKKERDLLTSFEITINAIAIETNQSSDSMSNPFGLGNNSESAENSLSLYLERNVKTGFNSFVIKASDFHLYSDAFKRQIQVMLNACMS